MMIKVVLRFFAYPDKILKYPAAGNGARDVKSLSW